MRNLFFAVGSLGVAIGAVLLVAAVLAYMLVGRELIGSEKTFIGVAACVIGGVWWAVMRNKQRNRRQS